MTHPFRFGVNLSSASRTMWVEKCRKAEELGYDVIGVPDHIGLPAPFPALMLAAEVTERVRVGTYVLNAPFFNSGLLARDVATLDQFTDGRVELGLGAGYVQGEFDAIGMRFPGAGERVDMLAETIATLRGHFADPGYRPRPARPSGPPLLIAGWGDRVLRLAAEHADIVAFLGAGTATDGTLRLAGATETAQRVRYVRGLLGDRADTVEFNLLIQRLVAPGESAGVSAELRGYISPDATDELDQVPTLLTGTPAQMADSLRERRERYGFNYFTVLESNLEKFAPLIELLR
ncbi:TIGR03621 family F420-dependent LLM class oxidoreductase [Nocardia terpenica]|uniref:F420-dependent oxidoreductase n=1 Tax=Nocardia terpenica TaxID=455432 RepID=A0A291RJE8_9NOCA|nr:TIGR03621 family F420-dependent LLM class oxidoreductase [Nocardia terpenica]ATL67202.1 F420-dependent oxidoreductase [Nocardia terpenica]